jgi:ZIP family zinc transporter
VGLDRSGRPRRDIRMMWWGMVAVSSLSAGLGYIIVSNSPVKTGASVQAFAAGALLTMIADEMAPEAYSRAAIATGISTTLGFVLSAFLTSLE